MTVKFFGQFLIEKRVIGREDLQRAIELQKNSNRKFGETALSMGLVTMEEIELARHAQRTHDLRMGEMLVRLAILTEDKKEQVAAIQKERHLYIGEALVRLRALNRKDMLSYLQEFMESQAPYALDRPAIAEGVPHPELLEVMADMTYKMLARVAEISFKPGQCRMVRRMAPNAAAAFVDFSGCIKVRYALSVSGAIRNAIERSFPPEREALESALCAFVKAICDNVATRAALLGKPIEPSPPQLHTTAAEGMEAPPNRVGLSFPLYLAEDEGIEMAIFV